MPTRAFRLILCSSVLLAASACPVAAQCTQQWSPGDGYPGVFGTVEVMTTWDPDGVGPAPEVLVLAGTFSLAGDTDCSNIVLYEPSTETWTPLGLGVSGTVHALTTLFNGDLVVGGAFASAGGAPASNVARWDGSNWWPLGSGTNDAVLSLATLTNGDVVAGGSFTLAGGAGAGRIARWDGATWSGLGTGVSWGFATAKVESLAVLPNGDLVAGGWFTQAGGSPAVGIARWDGTSWSPIGGGMNSAVVALLVRANGDLVAGGPFGTAGGATAVGIASWNGTAWSPLGAGMFQGGGAALGHARALAELPGGALVAAGSFDLVDGVAARRIASWDGTSWSALGAGIDLGTSISGGAFALATLAGGDLVVGGRFVSAGGFGAGNAARWNGTAWRSLDAGANGAVTCVAPLRNGGFVVGGRFTTIGGQPANRIACWDGANWSNLGNGLDGEVVGVTATTVGEIVAVGSFTNAGGVPTGKVARWNGATWSPLGTSVYGYPFCVTSLPNGDVVVGGAYLTAGGVSGFVLRWDGANWSALGNLTDLVNTLHVTPTGELFAGGLFRIGGSGPYVNVARLTGSTWTPLGSGTNEQIFAMTSLPNGDLVAGGLFTSAGGVPTALAARWNGTSWSAMPGLPATPGMSVRALATLANGDVVAGGLFTIAGGPENLARWNGTAWSSFGPEPDSAVYALHVRPNGDLLAGGTSLHVGTSVAPFLAQLTTTCPASVVDAGGGCAANALASASLPWVGSVFRGTGSGLPGTSLVGIVSGFTPAATPLAAVLPQGLPGCDLLVSPDAVEFVFTATGAVETAVSIPNNPSLAGLGFRQQLVPLAVDANLNVLSVTSSNVLVMTLGVF